MIRGILLAAGESARFGSPKLLHRLPNSSAIGAQAARNLIAGTGNALAVIRPGHGDIAALMCEAGCDIYVARRALEGMGSSLAAAIESSRDASGWVVALADMPFIDPLTIAAVKAALERGAALAAPLLNATGERGHPVGFSSALMNELLALNGDRGARAVIEAHLGELIGIPTDDGGVIADIDVVADIGKADAGHLR